MILAVKAVLYIIDAATHFQAACIFESLGANDEQSLDSV